MDKILKQWIYECLGVLIKEPTEENRKIVAETIASEVEDKYTNELKEKEKFIKTLFENGEINL